MQRIDELEAENEELSDNLNIVINRKLRELQMDKNVKRELSDTFDEINSAFSLFQPRQLRPNY